MSCTSTRSSPYPYPYTSLLPTSTRTRRHAISFVVYGLVALLITVVALSAANQLRLDHIVDHEFEQRRYPVSIVKQKLPPTNEGGNTAAAKLNEVVEVDSAVAAKNTPSPTTTPQQRLARLNSQYSKHNLYDAFGVGSVDLERYKNDLVQFIHDVNLRSRSTVAPDGSSEADTDRITESLECHLNLSCDLASLSENSNSTAAPTLAHRVPRDIIVTAAHASDFQSDNMLQLRRLNPDYVLHCYTDENVAAFIHRLFPLQSSNRDDVSSIFNSLPLEIVKYDWFRYIAVMLYGGFYTDVDTYPLRPLDDLMKNELPGLKDITDPLLFPNHDPESTPELIVGIEWLGKEKNVHNKLYARSQGIVQWHFAAAPHHPVMVEATKRVWEHSQRAAKNEYAARPGMGDDDALAFDPTDPMKKLVVEWSGPAVFTDCVARYLQTYQGVSLSSLAHTRVPLRIGGVLLLPISSLQTREYLGMRWIDWMLGRDFAPWSKELDVLRHDHTHVWWKAKIKEEQKTT